MACSLGLAVGVILGAGRRYVDQVLPVVGPQECL